LAHQGVGHGFQHDWEEDSFFPKSDGEHIKEDAAEQIVQGWQIDFFLLKGLDGFPDIFSDIIMESPHELDAAVIGPMFFDRREQDVFLDQVVTLERFQVFEDFPHIVYCLG
jgi:hypothetical protein